MKFLLLIQWLAAFSLFFLMFKDDTMFAFCVLIFSLIYLFGLLESRKDPQRIRAHIMVGGIMFFVAAVLIFLNDLSRLELKLNLSRILLIVLGLVGLVQARLMRKQFK
jgi:amino acid transporter